MPKVTQLKSRAAKIQSQLPVSSCYTTSSAAGPRDPLLMTQPPEQRELRDVSPGISICMSSNNEWGLAVGLSG